MTGTKRYRLPIGGMTCDACERHVRDALTDAGAREVEVSFRRGTAEFTADASFDAEAASRAIQRAGYRADRPLAVGREHRQESGGGIYDLAIIGGGSAAFAAAIRARDLGAAVLMIEREEMGGTCVNIGCVPSKALLRASELYYAAGHHDFAGIRTEALGVHLPALVEQKRQLVVQMRQAKYGDLIDAYGWDYRLGAARFLDAATLSVDGDAVKAGAYLIATGAFPWAPPIPGLAEAGYLTSTSALELEALPPRLLVVGANAVGLELGQYFHHLGSHVTFLEMLPRLAPFEEPEISAALLATFEHQGIGAELSVRIERVELDSGLKRIVFTDQEGRSRSLEGDEILVATGRRPNTSNLGLEKAGVAVDQRGSVITDTGLRTANSRVWAAGDCTAAPQFVYVSAYEGTLAVDNILTEAGRTVDFLALPKVTFTSPQIASVGLGEEEATKGGHRVRSVLVPLEAVPRAIVNRDTWGVIKLISEEESGRILGLHILAESAGEMIQTGVLAIKYKLTMQDLRETFFPYLTQVEGIKLAVQAFDRDPALLSCCAS